MEELKRVPQWVELLLATTFFLACEIHTKYKNECNKFCIDCMGDPFCSHCIPTSHKDHNVIQIRRSSYHECIRVADIKDNLDLTGVHPFVINGAKVIFLNKRGRCLSQTKAANGGGPIRNNLCKGAMTECMTCERTLVEPYHFCSIECKLDCIKKDESGTFVLSVKKDEEEEKEKAEETKGVPDEELPQDDEPALESKEKGKEVEEGTSSKQVSQNEISPYDPDKPAPKPNNYNSRKRKGIPRRAPFF
ncbi:hypothetical protein RIF29_27588 [Crotalaria pallida]|uniref:PLATZ transcription factor family protein n=1 Tax=Crotalaria pallida TaxID=3830 RepID=A0AAN9I160_CROPI